MIGNERVIAIVPARGGSKGIPGKNIRSLGGKPLIAWTLDMITAMPEIDRVIVSTDCLDIAQVAQQHGAEVYMRDPELATDTALVFDTVVALSQCLREEGEGAVYGLLLEPTAPFRKSTDIRSCLKRLHDERLDSAATFKPATLNPHRAWRIDSGAPSAFISDSVPWLPRQQLPEAYQLSGDVYAFRLDRLELASKGPLFGNAGAVIIDCAHSVDIDDEWDLRVAEFIVNEGNHEQITA